MSYYPKPDTHWAQFLPNRHFAAAHAALIEAAREAEIADAARHAEYALRPPKPPAEWGKPRKHTLRGRADDPKAVYVFNGFEAVNTLDGWEFYGGRFWGGEGDPAGEHVTWNRRPPDEELGGGWEFAAHGEHVSSWWVRPCEERTVSL